MKSEKFLLCGVDVGSKELVVAIETSPARLWEGVFSNDTAGHRKLIRRPTAMALSCERRVGSEWVPHTLTLPQGGWRA